MLSFLSLAISLSTISHYPCGCSASYAAPQTDQRYAFMVFLPFAESFCARNAAWSDDANSRLSLRAATAAATAAKRTRIRISLVDTGVERFTFLRRYTRLQSLLVVSAMRWVPSNIFAQLCWPFLPGFDNAPDTESIPALHSTFAILIIDLRVKQWGSTIINN